MVYVYFIEIDLVLYVFVFKDMKVYYVKKVGLSFLYEIFVIKSNEDFIFYFY